MFDGVPVEQFHQFISTPSSRNIPPNSLIQTPPVSTSTTNNLNFLSFDPTLFPPPIPNYHHHQTVFQSNNFLPTPTRDQYHDTECKVDQEMDLGIGVNDSWSDDEVIQLLRIKSSSEDWFKDLTWDHVSRKLAEMGYTRSAEKCKEKFQEETCRSFSNYNKTTSSRFLITEELEEHLYHNSDQNTHYHVTIESDDLQEQANVQNKESVEAQGQSVDALQVTEGKKRKRNHNKFKMIKGLCIDFVKQMMDQQEEMHKKLLEDIASQEEENIRKEEAWRKEDMERVKREIHIREHEQEMARDRQSTITEFLNKIMSFDQKIQVGLLQTLQTNITDIDKVVSLHEMTKIPLSENNPDKDQPVKDDTGKRWPRDEVLALINIRSNVNHGSYEELVGNNKGGGSLWERISQGMLELGYKRSAKRCKEKWENINKYFRKTKDANKKRSLDSRTCPYYHELSKLYNNEKLASSSSNSIANEPQDSKLTEEN